MEISERKKTKKEANKQKSMGSGASPKINRKIDRKRVYNENDPNGNIDWKKEMQRKRKG
jgi:hypothetical protein